MADQNLAAVLAALTGGAQQRPAVAPGASQMPPGYGLPVAQAPIGIGSPPPSFALPQPTASGSMDLSKIKPSVSGKVDLQDVLAKAKARAVEMGAHPGAAARYDDPRARYGRRSRSRSRSPPRRGPDPYRDSYSTFRDERRGRNNESFTRRDRSLSPQRGGGGRSGGSATGSGYSPPPRDRYGQPIAAPGARQRSPAPDMEQINIDASLVGLIIGRGGENLRRVESETGARVQFMTNGHDRDSGGERVCNIQGNRQQIGAARHAIESIIAENEKNGSSGPPAARKFGGGGGSTSSANAAAMGVGGGGAPNLRDGEESTQIYVPDRTVGLIIGRGGETIRDIQDKSGCHVNIVGEAKSQNGQRPVNLIGSPSASEHAKRLIMEIVESDTNGGPPGPPSRPDARGPPPQQQQMQPQQQQQQYFGGGGGGGGAPMGAGNDQPQRVTETMRVPIDAVGMIIGKGGETIKEMQNSTGCRINVSSQFNPNDQEREISLAGNRDAIARARQAIDEKVEASLNKSRNNPRGNYNNNNQSSGNDWGASSGANSYSSAQQPASGSAQPAAAATGAAASADDPYAAYGGYQNYCAMYYAAMMQQQQAAAASGGSGGAAPSAGGPPGT